VSECVLTPGLFTLDSFPSIPHFFPSPPFSIPFLAFSFFYFPFSCYHLSCFFPHSHPTSLSSQDMEVGGQYSAALVVYLSSKTSAFKISNINIMKAVIQTACQAAKHTGPAAFSKPAAWELIKHFGKALFLSLFLFLPSSLPLSLFLFLPLSLSLFLFPSFSTFLSPSFSFSQYLCDAR
jgi:hypothetical protein